MLVSKGGCGTRLLKDYLSLPPPPLMSPPHVLLCSCHCPLALPGVYDVRYNGGCCGSTPSFEGLPA